MIGERLGSMALVIMLLIGGVLMHIWIGKLSTPHLGGTRITSPDQVWGTVGAKILTEFACRRRRAMVL
jgi:hypothetical protein